MGMWIFYKAKPHERKRNDRRNIKPFPELCRICGTPLKGNGTMCKSCKEFINQKRNEERKRKK